MNETLASPPSMAGPDGYPLRSTTNWNWYEQLARDSGLRRHRETIVIAARTGKAFKVLQGEICRITCPDGPQVADMIVFGLADPSERFWAARTRVVHGTHLTVGAQLWSTPPKTRPIMTLIADTVDRFTSAGARPHDLLFCRCDSRLYELVHNRTGAPNCNDNLASAIAEFGLDASHVHDPFNVFMTTGLNREGRPFYVPAIAKRGDYVELVAEIDCLVAISACPGGSSGPVSRPLRIDLFEQSQRE